MMFLQWLFQLMTLDLIRRSVQQVRNSYFILESIYSTLIVVVRSRSAYFRTQSDSIPSKSVNQLKKKSLNLLSCLYIHLCQ